VSSLSLSCHTYKVQNISAATGALISALPGVQRFNSSDTLLPADAFTHSYSLCLTLAVLFQHGTVIINSVAGPGIDLSLASRSIAPTIAVISAETAAKLHSTTTTSITSGLKKLAHYIESKVLASGRLPTASLLNRLNAPTRAPVGNTPGKLRLLFISERAGLNTPPLTSTDLSDLRVYTGARVIYALTAAKVAGAVAQSNVYDYRTSITSGQKHSHFGVPVSSVEVKLKDTPTHKTTDEQSVGELVVTGSSVAGGEAYLGVNCMFTCPPTAIDILLNVSRYLPRGSHFGLCLRPLSERVCSGGLFTYQILPWSLCLLSILDRAFDFDFDSIYSPALIELLHMITQDMTANISWLPRRSTAHARVVVGHRVPKVFDCNLSIL